MEVEVRRDGKIYALAFEEGKTVEKMHVIGTSESTGSKTVFGQIQKFLKRQFLITAL